MTEYIPITYILLFISQHNIDLINVHQIYMPFYIIAQMHEKILSE